MPAAENADDLLAFFLEEGRAIDERPKAAPRPARPTAPRPADQVGRSPGDAYNLLGEAGWLGLLGEYGWRVESRSAGEVRLTRPGKDAGVSATLGHCKTEGGLPRLKVFSTNAHPFEVGDGITYDLFGACALLKHSGDLAAAARDLAAKGYGEQGAELNWKPSEKSRASKLPDSGPRAAGRRLSAPPPWVPFPTDRLPPPLDEYARAAVASIGCDAAAVAVPLLAVFAGIIGNRRRVGVDGLTAQPCCLWAAVVGETGTMKSPGWGAADDIADDIDQRLESGSRVVLAEWRQKAEAGGEPGPKPPAEKLIVEDITIETVAATLEQNPNGVLVSMDELSVWFDLFTRYRKGGGSDVNRWLGMWEGRRLKVSRRTSGELYIPRALVSVVGTIQPGMLARAIKQDERESGFLSRLLLVYPPVNQKRWTGTKIPAELREKVADLAGRLRELEPADVCLSAEARDFFIAKYNQLGAAEWVEPNQDKRAAMAKCPRLMLRLAGIHHAITRTVSGEPFGAEPVGMESIQFGADLAVWFMDELQRVYLLISQGPLDRQAATICEWVRRKGGKIKPYELKKHRNDIFQETSNATVYLDDLVSRGAGQWAADGKTFIVSDPSPGEENDEE